jgi:hypothetical protein
VSNLIWHWHVQNVQKKESKLKEKKFEFKILNFDIILNYYLFKGFKLIKNNKFKHLINNIA